MGSFESKKRIKNPSIPLISQQSDLNRRRMPEDMYRIPDINK
jgi:hypothetical protein